MEDKEAVERLLILRDLRLSHFNTRREYEWKTYFGAIGSIVAIDAASLQYGLQMERAKIWWIALIALIFLISAWYEFELQRRNQFDRHALNEINNRICEMLSLPIESSIYEGRARTGNQVGARAWHKTKPFNWTYINQMALLFVVATGSIALPFLGLASAREGSRPTAAPCQIQTQEPQKEAN